MAFCCRRLIRYCICMGLVVATTGNLPFGGWSTSWGSKFIFESEVQCDSYMQSHNVSNASSTQVLPVMMCSEDGILASSELGGNQVERKLGGVVSQLKGDWVHRSTSGLCTQSTLILHESMSVWAHGSASEIGRAINIHPSRKHVWETMGFWLHQLNKVEIRLRCSNRSCSLEILTYSHSS
ncbi:hypothetical protein MKW98_013968 [Papaver atlanticum]|uniref:Uncharacterized protein n=1 Tax=Papaver atlanticum TaxID=357466 RepID=A0AAD4XGQ9_9MAGN|nr:hypothetical protein MKW98_013968 [Papaver atlanticum]